MKSPKRIGAGVPGTTREAPAAPKPTTPAKGQGRIANLGAFAHPAKKGGKKS